jgi:hypothetical protein
MILSIEDDEVSIHFPIESNNLDKKHMFSLTLEEVFFERKPSSILGCPSTSMIL